MERFSKDHEWVRVEGDVATVGITTFAQEKLGDVVFVEVPEVGRRVAAGEACAVVESVKAASDVFAPLSGEVVEVNADLAGEPALVNAEAEGRAWFFRVRMSNRSELDGLMDRAAYETFARENG
jgi:glycine cleavage system H protein